MSWIHCFYLYAIIGLVLILIGALISKETQGKGITDAIIPMLICYLLGGISVIISSYCLFAAFIT